MKRLASVPLFTSLQGVILSSLPRTSEKRNNTADMFMECCHDLEYSNIDKGMPFKDETLKRAYSHLKERHGRNDTML